MVRFFLALRDMPRAKAKIDLVRLQAAWQLIDVRVVIR